MLSAGTVPLTVSPQKHLDLMKLSPRESRHDPSEFGVTAMPGFETKKETLRLKQAFLFPDVI